MLVLARCSYCRAGTAPIYHGASIVDDDLLGQPLDRLLLRRGDRLAGFGDEIATSG